MYFLLLPAVGRTFGDDDDNDDDDDEDDAIYNAIQVLVYNQGVPDSIGSDTSVFDITETHSQSCPALLLASKGNKCDGDSPPILPSSS